MKHGARPTPRQLAWLFHIVLAPLLFWLLQADEALNREQHAPYVHFWVVSLAATAGLAIAWVVTNAAWKHSDSRVFLIALAFFSISGIFLLHALSTENLLFSQGEAGFIWSPPLCLLLGSVFFALSSVRLGDGINAWLLANQRQVLALLVAVLVGYALTVVVFPETLMRLLGLHTTAGGGYEVVGEGGAANGVLVAMLTVAVALYLTAAWRYYAAYRRRQSVLLLSILTGMVLFAEADVFMAFSEAWYLSWWLYHIQMIAAFLMVGYGILAQYSQRRPRRGLFEELFLREEIARINDRYTEVMIGLINSLEAKDRYTKGHSGRVAQYATLLARGMGYDEEGQKRVEQGALLHDIGKLAIPDAILNKPGKLTPEEMAFIKSHPARGCVIIQSIDSLSDKIPGIRHHHEWMDGSGYPDGLRGEEIPLDARIIAVADVYDAMTSLRAYRQPLTRSEAVDHLRQEAGAHLDELCVELFIELSEREPIQITDFTRQLTVDELVPRTIEIPTG